MKATPSHPAEFTPSSFTKYTNEGPLELVKQWPELLSQLFHLFHEFDRRVRWVAREEYELLAAEKAATAEEADRNEQVLTVAEAAQLLEISTQTVYEWVKAQKLTHFKLDRHVRFKRGHVMAALKLQTQPDGRRKYARRTTARSGKPS
ncbi:MAG TPA: helix-turn-helix domain-containing protein [Hymenobacter sp.]|jgi:excisionase family DNA binding protein